MKPNLGRLDRVLRFALAIWWLGPWAPHYQAAWANAFIVVVGWIALAESFAAFCLLQHVLGLGNAEH